ncbi:MAG: 2OG-Fe dioxygenase family protein [Polyangiales bacterium]
MNQTSSPSGELAAAIASSGHVLVEPAQLTTTLGLAPTALAALAPAWESLPRDAHLRDGGRYRRRRHACFVQARESTGWTLTQAPHRAHFQPTDYNALHGGIERWFEPIEPAVTSLPAWTALVVGIGAIFGALSTTPRWYVEAHQFRIDTTDGIGRPTPEGAHRDGVDYVAVILVQRRQVRGGETRVFELSGSSGVRFTIEAPFTALLLDDARVMHETTPILPDGERGLRDTLVLTYRAAGFQSPDGP